MALDVTTETFEQEVINSDRPVLVDFWAEWCGPCHAVAPVLDRIAAEREDELKLVKVNIDQRAGALAALRRRFDPDDDPLQGRRAVGCSDRRTAEGRDRALARPDRRLASLVPSFPDESPAPAGLSCRSPRMAMLATVIRVSPRHVPASVTELSRVGSFRPSRVRRSRGSRSG